MSDQIKIEHLGGWPRILKEAPVRPHDYMDPESHDESDEPHNIELRLLGKFSDAKNIYAVFSAFIEFHKLGLYPPRWALDHMVACLQKHMNDPQPELFTSRMGVVGQVLMNDSCGTTVRGAHLSRWGFCEWRLIYR